MDKERFGFLFWLFIFAATLPVPRAAISSVFCIAFAIGWVCTYAPTYHLRTTHYRTSFSRDVLHFIYTHTFFASVFIVNCVRYRVNYLIVSDLGANTPG